MYWQQKDSTTRNKKQQQPSARKPQIHNNNMWVEINIIWSCRVENKAIFVASFQAIRQSTHFPPFLWHLTEFYSHPSTISCFPWSLHLVWRERSKLKIFQFWKKTSQQQTWAFFCDLNSWGKHLTKNQFPFQGPQNTNNSNIGSLIPTETQKCSRFQYCSSLDVTCHT